MLKNLVKKFKTHSLNEETDEVMTSSPIQQPQHGMVTRTGSLKNSAIIASPSGCHRSVDHVFVKPVLDLDKDSGTESDEELERIETNSAHSVPISQTSDYYASQQSLSASCRSSHCGSPGAFSDQESNSWDNVTMESVSFFETPDLPNHHYHTRQQFQRFLKQHQMNCSPLITDKNNVQISMMKNGILESTPVDQPYRPPPTFLSPNHYRNQQQSICKKPTTSTESSVCGNSISACSPTTMINQYSNSNNVYSKRALTFPLSDSTTTAAKSTTTDNGKSAKTAFLPVRRLRSEPSSRTLSNEIVAEVDETVSEHAGNVEDNDNSNGSTSTFSSSNSSISDSSTNNRIRSCSLTTTTSEKRKWSQVRNNSSSSNSIPVYANFLPPNGFTNGYGNSLNAVSSGNFFKNQVLPPEFLSFSSTISNNDANNRQDMRVLSKTVLQPATASRPLLTAARKTPVKFLIPPNGMTSSAFPDWSIEAPTNDDDDDDEECDTSTICPSKYCLRVTQATANKISPRKKCRHDEDEPTDRNDCSRQQQHQAINRRPSLNFDKMREKLVRPLSKKKCQFYNNVQTKLKTRGCSNIGYQLRSSRSECLFRPVHRLNDVFASNNSTMTSSVNLCTTAATALDDVITAPSPNTVDE